MRLFDILIGKFVVEINKWKIRICLSLFLNGLAVSERDEQTLWVSPGATIETLLTKQEPQFKTKQKSYHKLADNCDK